jgi:hypothetical protein
MVVVPLGHDKHTPSADSLLLYVPVEGSTTTTSCSTTLQSHTGFAFSMLAAKQRSSSASFALSPCLRLREHPADQKQGIHAVTPRQAASAIMSAVHSRGALIGVQP